jgi:hypothetical protein
MASGWHKAWLAAAMMFWLAPPAAAWGPQGHKVVALIAQAHLEPAVRAQVQALLAADEDPLTAHDIAAASIWADVYRSSSTAAERATGKWHFMNLDLHRPNLAWACYHFPRLAPAQAASAGPANDCVMHKIEQFERELRDPSTKPQERLLALKFLLHLVGDLHQPLHVGDDHDRGGNELSVRLPDGELRNLHAAWDSYFVEGLDQDPIRLAARLDAQITPEQRRLWQHGSPQEWAWESWRVARDEVYARLPAASGGSYQLDADYEANAKRVAAVQLQKAGLRLAWLVNLALQSAP